LGGASDASRWTRGMGVPRAPDRPPPAPREGMRPSLARDDRGLCATMPEPRGQRRAAAWPPWVGRYVCPAVPPWPRPTRRSRRGQPYEQADESGGRGWPRARLAWAVPRRGFVPGRAGPDAPAADERGDRGVSSAEAQAQGRHPPRAPGAWQSCVKPQQSKESRRCWDSAPHCASRQAELWTAGGLTPLGRAPLPRSEPGRQRAACTPPRMLAEREAVRADQWQSAIVRVEYLTGAVDGPGVMRRRCCDEPA
jgi:hypothetical protein